MRATAFEPPPPTPITLILVPSRASSWMANFSAFISGLLSVTISKSVPTRPGALRFRSRVSIFNRPEYMASPGRGGPGGIVKLVRANPRCPCGSPLRAWTVQNALRHVAHAVQHARRRRSARRLRTGSGPCRCVASSAFDHVEQLLGARFQNFVQTARGASRGRAALRRRHLDQAVVGGEAEMAQPYSTFSRSASS